MLKDIFMLRSLLFLAPEDGNSGSGGSQGETDSNETGATDYTKLLDDPKFQEAVVNSKFFKTSLQSAEDRLRTKYTGEKKTWEQEAAAFKEELSVLKGERLENIKTSVIEEIGIPLKFRTRITGTTKEEMLESAKALKADIDEIVNSTVSERLKTAGTTPNAEKKGEKVDAALEAFEKNFKF